MSTPPRPPGKTLYDILGIAATASPEEVSAAYRARQAEIDARADPDPAAALAVREAFQLLSSLERRQRYDAGLSIAVAVSEAVPLDPPPNRRLLLGVVIVAVVAGLIGARMMASSTKPAVAPAPKIAVPTQDFEPAKPDPEAPSDETKAVEAPPAAAPAAVAEPWAGQRRATPIKEWYGVNWNSVPSVITQNAQGKFSGRGSGVVVEPDTIVTACHVVAGASRITSAEAFVTTVVADEELNLCKLRMRNFYERRILKVAPLEEVRPGQRVLAIGAPWDLEEAAAEGTVIALSDVGRGVMIQISMEIPPGWDGGGLFNSDGRLVGILTASYRHANGMNLAIPAERIAQIKARSAAAAPALEPAAGLAKQLRGLWSCRDPWDRHTGEYDFGADGTFRIRFKSGREHSSRYRLEGMSIRYGTANEPLTIQVETIGIERLVSYVDLDRASGKRLVCERNDGLGR